MVFHVLGMTADAERVYACLIRKPRCTASELATSCSMSVPAVVGLLSQLTADGLATRTAGRPPRFIAAAPDIAISTLITEREKELAEARKLGHTLPEAHREATRIVDPDMAVELLTNRDDVSAAARRLSAVAQREVCAFDRPPYVNRPGSNLEGQLERQKDGVAHRVIYDQAAVAWPGRLHNDIIPSMRAGELARVGTDLPLKLVIADDRTAIIPFSLAPGGQSAAYLVHESPVLTALKALFEAHWERATPIAATLTEGASTEAAATEAAPPEAALDETTQTLLTLLAAGLTDVAIARSQGWSERTTQRRVQQLMTRLGAATRFQACLLAARRGWL